MEIFIIWLIFVILSLFFWAIGKRKGIVDEDKLPFLVKICYTMQSFPFFLLRQFLLFSVIYLYLF